MALLPSKSFGLGTVLGLVALGVVAVSARPYAGSWNDGCRLAPVETLIDHHTWVIDRSIFVQVPQPRESSDPTPYPRDNVALMRDGTLDKLCIRGKFYSDKPPVMSLLLAGAYQVWQWLGGPTARERPDLFCYLMTVISSGVGYVLAVVCMYGMGLKLRLPLHLNLLLTASLALSTFALAYTRHVNSHIVLLGVLAALMLSLIGEASLARLFTIGSLAGLGYALDLGIGPVLVMCLLPLLIYRRPRLSTALMLGLAALPWFATHHALNYAVGGTFGPANALAEYHQWPGCPFDAASLTGGWNHSAGHFATYSAALLFGKRGFIGHNLPLFLVLAAGVTLLPRRRTDSPELWFTAALCGGVWLMYAALSTNYAGACCSIRWFLPLLAPAYFLLAVLLRDHPSYRWDFIVLSAWGLMLSAIMWWYGPWILHMVPMFWPIQACALLSWGAVRWWMRERAPQSCIPDAPVVASGLGGVA